MPHGAVSAAVAAPKKGRPPSMPPEPRRRNAAEKFGGFDRMRYLCRRIGFPMAGIVGRGIKRETGENPVQFPLLYAPPPRADIGAALLTTDPAGSGRCRHPERVRRPADAATHAFRLRRTGSALDLQSVFSFVRYACACRDAEAPPASLASLSPSAPQGVGRPRRDRCACCRAMDRISDHCLI